VKRERRALTRRELASITGRKPVLRRIPPPVPTNCLVPGGETKKPEVPDRGQAKKFAERLTHIGEDNVNDERGGRCRASSTT
jgi:hypothetical protein